jgi:four helix bundle protein
MTDRKKINDFKDLLVWQKSIRLAKAIYEITRNLPKEERFGLASQMRRAAISVPSNIAEGQARNTTGEFIQFISHAEGSLAELETQLILGVELKFWQVSDTKASAGLITELRKMLGALRRALVAGH